MRVKALVVAAMAITSVNAGLSDRVCDVYNRVLGCFGLGNSMSRAESRERLILNGPSRDPESAKRKLSYDSGGDERDLICNPVIFKLYELHDKAVELSSKIPDRRKVSYELSRWWGQDPDRDEQGFIEIDRMVARSELNDQDSPELKEIKKDLMALEREYREVWMGSINDCWIKFIHVLSPKEMLEKGFFFRRTRVVMLDNVTAPPFQ
ncbi:hypothetical protein BASA83_011223 [Batrachochytrium salamandrivorans]|nr:hypothetical protein BASA83_011223 [Batrachochytrium salamandrivorans]